MRDRSVSSRAPGVAGAGLGPGLALALALVHVWGRIEVSKTFR
jgi:hypothetical protein